MATRGLHWTIPAALLALVAVLTPDAARAQTCIPGQQLACACPGGAQGVQVCQPDGRSLGPCRCEGEGSDSKCFKDTDCPGDQVCNKGACSEQGAATPAEAGSEPRPDTGEAAPSVPTTTGTIRVHSTQPGTVFVDKGQVGRVEGEPFDVKGVLMGRHKVEVEFDHGGSETEQVTVTQGAVSEVRFESEAPTTEFNSPAMLGVGIASMVVGLTAAIIGIAFIADAPERSYSTRAEVEDDKETGGGVALGLGGAVLVAGVVLTIAGAWQVPIEPGAEEAATAITIAPLIGPTGGGLRLRF